MADVESQDGKQSRFSNFMLYLEEEVTEAWSDMVLLLCCFVTGLLDSAVFNVWSCFVSMQTGNTIYVGLGVSGQPKDQPWRWAKSGTSIIAFILGCFFFSRMMRYLGPLRRSTMMLSCLLQALLCFFSAALVTGNVVPREAGQLLPDNFIVLLPLALLALQSAGQIIVSRYLGFSELTSVVLTSAYCDLAHDEKVLTAPPTQNAKRNRRIASMIMTAVGAIAGGFLSKNRNIAPSLWLAGALKVVVSMIWLGWKSKGSIRLE